MTNEQLAEKEYPYVDDAHLTPHDFLQHTKHVSLQRAAFIRGLEWKGGDGNEVYVPDSNGEYFATALFESNVLPAVILKKIKLPIKSGDVVEITPELLISLGFKQQIENKTLFFLNEFRYSTKHKQIRLLRPCDKAGEAQQFHCGEPFITDRIEIKYAHQLMNLYLLLTGNPLPQPPKIN